MTRSTVLLTALASSLFLGVAAKAPTVSNTVFLIRHGEKPSDGGQGLNADGKERAQCLTSVFVPSNGFNIGYILAEKPQKNGDRARPRDTVTPLAGALGLSVDTSCDRDDADCVADAVAKFAKSSTKDVLICWEHDALTDIAESLGVKKAPDYPDDSFDVIWEVVGQKIVSQASENCPGLD